MQNKYLQSFRAAFILLAYLVYSMTHRYQKALDKLDEVQNVTKSTSLRIDRFPEFWEFRANALESLKRFDEALDSYRTAFRLAPTKHDLLINTG